MPQLWLSGLFLVSKRVLRFSLTWFEGLTTGDATTVQLQKAL